jgi:hypothetical protein
MSMGPGWWIFGFRIGQQNGRLICALWALAAGVLWPVLLLGVVELVVIVGALKWSARLTHLRVPPVERACLDEKESVPV